MFTTLEIKNFKSIGHAVFDLGKINVLTGQSNLGKSNVVQAIYCLTHNHWDSNYLKWGTKNCSIKLMDDTGVWVEYRHGADSSAEYHLSTVPQPFTKIGRDVPQPVRDFLQMNCVQFDEDLSLDFNFERQFDPSFVISLSGFELAKVFGKLMNLDIVLTASRNINKDLAGLKKQVDGQEAIENVSIEYIQKNYAIELKYGLLHQAMSIDAQAELLDQEVSKIKGLLCDLDFYSCVSKTYSDFLKSDAVRQIDQIKEPIQGLDTLLAGLQTAQETSLVYSEVISADVPNFDFGGFCELTRGIVDFTLSTDQMSVYSQAFEQLDRVDLTVVDSLSANKEILGLIAQWEIEKCHEQSQYEKADFQVVNKTQEFKQALIDNNVCPISGKPFEQGCVENILASV